MLNFYSSTQGQKDWFHYYLCLDTMRLSAGCWDEPPELLCSGNEMLIIRWVSKQQKLYFENKSSFYNYSLLCLTLWNGSTPPQSFAGEVHLFLLVYILYMGCCYLYSPNPPLYHYMCCYSCGEDLHLEIWIFKGKRLDDLMDAFKKCRMYCENHFSVRCTKG